MKQLHTVVHSTEEQRGGYWRFVGVAAYVSSRNRVSRGVREASVLLGRRPKRAVSRRKREQRWWAAVGGEAAYTSAEFHPKMSHDLGLES